MAKKSARGKSVTRTRMKHKGSKHRSLESILKKSKVVAMDADNTLYDYSKVATKAYNKVLTDRGLSEVSESYVQTALNRASPKTAFKLMGMSEADAEVAVGEYEEAYSNFNDYVVPKGTVRLLRTLKDNDKKVSVVSNAAQPYLDQGLQSVVDTYNAEYNTNESIASIFHQVVAMQSNRSRNKPSAYGLKKVKADVYIGDRPKDAEAAENAKIPSIIVLQSEDSSSNFDSIPDRLAPDIGSLAYQAEKIFAKPEAFKPEQYQTQLSYRDAA